MISIITPVYNSAQFIETCIQNVAGQVFPSVEHLIIDGGSTDGTVEIIKQSAEKYPHIRWVSEKDKGQSDAMNKGIYMAKNPVISFLNADDFYAKDALSFAHSLFKNALPNTFMVGNCRVLREDGSEYMINRPSPFNPVNFMLDYNFPFNPSAYFYHKSLHDLVGFYDVQDHLTMDIDFILRLLSVAQIEYRDKLIGNYVMVANSKTMQEISLGRNIENLRLVFEKHLDQLTLFQRVNLNFQRMLGKNRGWVMFYLSNPANLVKKLLGKSA